MEDDQKFIAQYSQFENKIIFSKKSVEKVIDNELEFLGYKEIERKNIGYLNIGYNTRLLYPFYINEKDIRKAIARFIILLSMYHEIWHSIDFSILPRVFLNHVIKDIDFDTFLKNFELRASAFQVVMYYLVSGLYKDEEVYKTVHDNILICRKYIEEINELQNDKNKNKYVPYDLGFCYGNVIVAKYKSSLDKYIYKIIDDIIHLNKERAIDIIKLYGDNLDKQLYG